MRPFAAIVSALVVTLTTFLVALYVFQPRFIYHPGASGDARANPARVGLDYEVVRISTHDGETLSAWHVRVDNPRGTVLFLPGSAGSKAARIAWLPMFRAMSLNVLLIDYRGFGESTGRPSEAGTYADAEAAWRFLTRERSQSPRSIILFGESLGGAVAAWLAAREAAGALVLHSTFTSLPDLAADTYPFLPMRRLTRYAYDTLHWIRHSRTPVLIVHSRDDEVIRYSHAQRLHAAAPAPKELLTMSGGHNSGLLYSRPEWTGQFTRFLAGSLEMSALAELRTSPPDKTQD